MGLKYFMATIYIPDMVLVEYKRYIHRELALNRREKTDGSRSWLLPEGSFQIIIFKAFIETEFDEGRSNLSTVQEAASPENESGDQILAGEGNGTQDSMESVYDLAGVLSLEKANQKFTLFH